MSPSWSKGGVFLRLGEKVSRSLLTHSTARPTKDEIHSWFHFQFEFVKNTTTTIAWKINSTAAWRVKQRQQQSYPDYSINWVRAKQMRKWVREQQQKKNKHKVLVYFISSVIINSLMYVHRYNSLWLLVNKQTGYLRKIREMCMCIMGSSEMKKKMTWETLDS